MAAYDSHLRKIHNNEAYYGGSKPKQKPFTTDRDIVDAHHKFLREKEPDEKADPLVKEYYESLIKDCVLVDLSRYKEKLVAMRWRTTDEVKAGKGDMICANVACGRTEGLEVMEVVFNYVEDEKAKTVLVKCILCEKCGRKMHRARGNEGERKRSRNRDRQKEEDKERRRRRHHHRERESSTDHEKKRRKEHAEDEDPARRKRRSTTERHESETQSQ